MNPKSWDSWVKYFTAKGYNCIAPAYPLHDGEPALLRKNIQSELGFLTLDKVIESIKKEIGKLDEMPIAIGHSMGGLITQMLVNQGLVKAGVAIDSAPPAGMASTKWSFLKSNLPVINPLKGNSPFMMSKEHFHYTFCNAISRAESDKAYEQFVVPESRNIPRSSGKQGKIDFTEPHGPLLLIAGEKDNIIPHSLNEKNWESYKDKASKTDFKMFANRGHFICGQPGWEEVADYAFSWLSNIK
jgi:pimeloyl-ACP methyl ester carboxylesterase